MDSGTNLFEAKIDKFMLDQLNATTNSPVYVLGSGVGLISSTFVKFGHPWVISLEEHFHDKFKIYGPYTCKISR